MTCEFFSKNICSRFLDQTIAMSAKGIFSCFRSCCFSPYENQQSADSAVSPKTHHNQGDGDRSSELLVEIDNVLFLQRGFCQLLKPHNVRLLIKRLNPAPQRGSYTMRLPRRPGRSVVTTTRSYVVGHGRIRYESVILFELSNVTVHVLIL